MWPSSVFSGILVNWYDKSVIDNVEDEQDSCNESELDEMRLRFYSQILKAAWIIGLIFAIAIGFVLVMYLCISAARQNFNLYTCMYMAIPCMFFTCLTVVCYNVEKWFSYVIYRKYKEC